MGANKQRVSLPPARDAALACLTLVLERGRDAQDALDQTLSARALDPRDAGLATELVYGYLRHKTRVDFVLSEFLRNPEKTPPPLIRVLSLAAYELLHLDRVPAYASVDWAVSFAKARYSPNLGKLTNAVLRRVGDAAPDVPGVSDQAPDLKFFRRKKDTRLTALSRLYSTPKWIIRLWNEHYGEEHALQYLKASAQAPPLGIRVNRRKSDWEELVADLTQAPVLIMEQAPGLLFETGALNVRDALQQGALSRQSFAAQQALQALQPESWPGPVWDACSGRGGKTCLLLERGVEVVAASDMSMGRLSGLKHELERLDLPRIPVFRASAADAAPLRKAPGAVLLDVPCSGLGVLSRRPDSKWRRTPQDAAGLADLQRRMLENAYNQIPAGGCAAYVTCTLNPDENEGVVQAFVEDTPGATVETQWSTPPDSPTREFFYAALVKKTS